MNDTITYPAERITGHNPFNNANLASKEETSISEDFYLRYLFQELNRMRMTGTFCDCILTTSDGAFFRVHKVVMALCSDYFRTLFTTPLVGKMHGDVEDQRKLYHIPNVSSSSLEAIINFAYSDVVQINNDNVNELLPAADQFNVKCVVNECVDFLLRNITAENCVGIWRFGNEYYIPNLEKEARK